jgi:hypothetical protein
MLLHVESETLICDEKGTRIAACLAGFGFDGELHESDRLRAIELAKELVKRWNAIENDEDEREYKPLFNPNVRH